MKIFQFITLLCLAFGLEQNYEASFDRAVLKYYDASMVSSNSTFQFRKINRTSFGLNISFDLLVDLDGRDIEVTETFYQLLSNEYRFLGINITQNACEIAQMNLFHSMDRLREYGNLEACDIKKGHYYLYNYIPDASFGPQNMIYGKFKVVMTIWMKRTGKVILVLYWFVGAEKKLRHYFHGR